MDWRQKFAIASREPHLRILQAARPGEWFDHDAAAVANGSTKQSVSRPLKELEATGLVRRTRGHPRDLFVLTDTGMRVRAVVSGGPSLLAGSWFLSIRNAAAKPGAVRRLLAEYADISVQSCAGDCDFLVLHSEDEQDEQSADLAQALRELAAEVTRQCVVGPTQ